MEEVSEKQMGASPSLRKFGRRTLFVVVALIVLLIIFFSVIGFVPQEYRLTAIIAFSAIGGIILLFYRLTAFGYVLAYRKQTLSETKNDVIAINKSIWMYVVFALLLIMGLIVFTSALIALFVNPQLSQSMAEAIGMLIFGLFFIITSLLAIFTRKWRVAKTEKIWEEMDPAKFEASKKTGFLIVILMCIVIAVYNFLHLPGIWSPILVFGAFLVGFIYYEILVRKNKKR